MLGQTIPEGDPHWENFTRLLNIVDILFAPICSKDWIAFLRDEINWHHQSFKDLYQCNITPKMHYMVHYPDMISR